MIIKEYFDVLKRCSWPAIFSPTESISPGPLPWRYATFPWTNWSILNVSPKFSNRLPSDIIQPCSGFCVMTKRRLLSDVSGSVRLQRGLQSIDGAIIDELATQKRELVWKPALTLRLSIVRHHQNWDRMAVFPKPMLVVPHQPKSIYKAHYLNKLKISS